MQKKYLFYALFAIVAAFIANACTNKSEILSIDRGEDYFPLHKGKYWDYKVDSISYKLRNTTNHTVDSFHRSFFVRELVGDTLRDAAGRPSYRLERYTRPSRDSAWKLEDVWLITRTTATAERVEEDQRFLKLAFPVNKATKWNCVQFIDPYTELSIWGERTVAAYSADKGWGVQSKYTSIDVPYTLNGRTYDSTATILFADSDANSSGGAGTNRRYYQEVYARNVGLIYKRLEILDTQCIDPATCGRANQPWEARAEVGFILVMKLDATN